MFRKVKSKEELQLKGQEESGLENKNDKAAIMAARRRASCVSVIVVIGLVIWTAGFLGIDVLGMIADTALLLQRGQVASKLLPPWQPGILDIHHLQVGSSVSTFVIMPDGTTMLIDAGDVNKAATEHIWKDQGPPLDKLTIRPPFPNKSNSPIGWIKLYMKEFWPKRGNGFFSQIVSTLGTSEMALDYLLLTHFHSDHVGDASVHRLAPQERDMSPSGNYLLSGIPELTHTFPTKRIIDRGFPNYNVPTDLRALKDPTVNNYLDFVQENRQTIAFEQFQVGSTQQIEMRNDPSKYDFNVRVIKSSLDVTVPYDPKLPKHEQAKVMKIENNVGTEENVHMNENVMSAAIVMEYGDFRYYEGADQEVVKDKAGNILLDTIGPTARAAGKVDVATLNHHGHGVNNDYITELDAPILILQGWSSDQPPNQSVEMLAEKQVLPSGKRKVPPKIFATDIFEERLQDLGPALNKMFASTSGHVVVRVHPHPSATAMYLRRREKQQIFEVYVLDGNRRIKFHHGHNPVSPKP